MRHDGRTEYPERQIEHVWIGDDLCRWSEAEDHLTPVRISKSDLNREADGDNAEQSYDKRFDPTEAKLLQVEDQEYVQSSDNHSQLERNSENEV